MSWPKSASAALAARPLRFLLVGFANTALGLIAVCLAKLLLDFGDIMANAVGYACGLAIAYLLNASWTFNYRGSNATAAPRFLFSFLLAYAVNLLTVWAALHYLSLNGYVAQILGILPYTALFYLLSNAYVFHASASDQAAPQRDGAAYAALPAADQ
jgi:putative flippase GtrA